LQWQAIEAPSAKLIDITARPDGRLVVVAADAVWEQVTAGASNGTYNQEWRPVSIGVS
jgi:hypothetical protein